MGSARSSPDKIKHTIVETHQSCSYAVSHMCGWRLHMEDAHIAETPLEGSNNLLFGVFDGHGGSEVSAFAAKHFSKHLIANQQYKKGNYEIALKQTFLGMDELMLTEKGQEELKLIHEQMIEKGHSSPQASASEAGCTANVILLTPTHIYCANSGDSRAVASVAGKTEPLSYDHKPEDKIEIDRITKAGGQIYWGRVNGNLNLTRAMGDFEYKKNKELKPQEQMITACPDIKCIENKNIDFIISGCDGIWESKSNEDMVKWVSKRLEDNKKQSEIVEELLDELLSKDGKSQFGMDNMTSILVKFNRTNK